MRTIVLKQEWAAPPGSIVIVKDVLADMLIRNGIGVRAPNEGEIVAIPAKQAEVANDRMVRAQPNKGVK